MRRVEPSEDEYNTIAGMRVTVAVIFSEDRSHCTLTPCNPFLCVRFSPVTIATTRRQARAVSVSSFFRPVFVLKQPQIRRVAFHSTAQTCVSHTLPSCPFS